MQNLKDYINNERKGGSNEQNIYESLVNSGYDREFVVNSMIHLAHPIDIKKAINYNRFLIFFVILGIIGGFLIGGDYPLYNMILSIIFIYFFIKYNITAYYWFLFFSILNIGSLLTIIVDNLDTIFISGTIGGVLIFTPIYLSRKIITILLPSREGNGIGITPNGIHIFPEK